MLPENSLIVSGLSQLPVRALPSFPKNTFQIRESRVFRYEMLSYINRLEKRKRRSTNQAEVPNYADDGSGMGNGNYLPDEKDNHNCSHPYGCRYKLNEHILKSARRAFADS